MKHQNINTCSESNDFLQFLSQEYNIDPIRVLDEMNDMSNQKIILKHEENFSRIWLASDGRYKSYLPSNNKSGRKLIASATRENIEKSILTYYKANSKRATSFKTLYFEWIDMKRLEVSNATIERITSSYKRYYEGHPINCKSLREMNFLYLKSFILSTIKEFDMDYKMYTNFKVVLNGVFQYAIDKEVIEINPLDRFHIGKKTLRSPDNKSNAKEVFSIEERKLIEEAIWSDFKASNCSTIALAILLDFYTGLRSGELVAISWSDISKDILHIHRTETSYTEILPDGTKGDVIYEVKESPKSDAGFRDIFLVPKALEVLDAIKKYNNQHNWDNEFIFLDNNERIIRKRLDTVLRKYCRRVGIPERSMHKIRKYYISSLKQGNVEDNEIRRLAGHKDLTTTFNSYCRSVLSDKQTKTLINQAL